MSESLWKIIEYKEGMLGFVNNFGHALEKHLNTRVKCEESFSRVNVEYQKCSPGYSLYWYLFGIRGSEKKFYGEINIQPEEDSDDSSVEVQRWGEINTYSEDCSSDELRDAAVIHDSVADFLKREYGFRSGEDQWGPYYIVSLPKTLKKV